MTTRIKTLTARLAVRLTSERGFSLIESLAALGILTVGLLGLAAVLTTALGAVTTSAADQLAKDKASEAIENIISARETKLITWDQLKNASQGGIFMDGAQAITQPGADRIIGTSDDFGMPAETIVQPGPDGALGTGDDVTLNLGNYTRQIEISSAGPAGAPDTLRQVKVTIVYKTAGKTRTISLSTLVSSYL